MAHHAFHTDSQDLTSIRVMVNLCVLCGGICLSKAMPAGMIGKDDARGFSMGCPLVTGIV